MSLDTEPSPISRESIPLAATMAGARIMKRGILDRWIGPKSSLNFMFAGDELEKRRYIRRLRKEIDANEERRYKLALFTGEYIPCFPDLHQYRPKQLYDWMENDAELDPKNDASVDEGVFAVVALRKIPRTQIAAEHIQDPSETA